MESTWEWRRLSPLALMCMATLLSGAGLVQGMQFPRAADTLVHTRDGPSPVLRQQGRVLQARHGHGDGRRPADDGQGDGFRPAKTSWARGGRRRSGRVAGTRLVERLQVPFPPQADVEEDSDDDAPQLRVAPASTGPFLPWDGSAAAEIISPVSPGASSNASKAMGTLPGSAERKAFEHRIRGCREAAASTPPESLVVFGLPNTGTNALVAALRSRLNVKVTDGAPGLWKHLMPFHPDLESRLSRLCSSLSSPSSEQQQQQQPRMGFVFSVHHPLAWLLSQTSPGHGFGHSFGYKKIQKRGGNQTRSCTFTACWSDQVSDDGRCIGISEPHKWHFSTLLDLWAAYALHLPSRGGFPFAMAVRYEDLLRNHTAALQRVSRHFGVRMRRRQPEEGAPASHGGDPLLRYLRPWDKLRSSTGLLDSQARLKSFQALWRQFGAQPVGRWLLENGEGLEEEGEEEEGEDPGGSRVITGFVPSGNISCVGLSDRGHHFLTPSHVEALREAEESGLLPFALRAYGYRVPESEVALKAWRFCVNRDSSAFGNSSGQ